MCEFTTQQKEMLDRFKSLKVGALFSQMGTGKTRVAVELVNYNKPDFLLYICPFSCKANVEAELIRWNVNCHFRIVGYETLSSSDRIYLEIRDELMKHKTNFIIADESIFIKKGTTKRFRRSCDLRQHCEYALVLNGTPITNNERDIYNQMEFLSHKIFNMTYTQFLSTYFIEHVYRKDYREIHTWTFYDPNRPAFSKVIAPYVYMADLAFKHEINESYKYHSIDTEIYNQVKDECLDKYGDGDALIPMFTALSTVAAEDESKNLAVAEYINNKKCIVYCSRKKEMEIIASNSNALMIDGDTKDKERKDIINEFTESDDKPLLLSFGVGAYSLNLQTANEIVYSSLTFNFGQYEQSMYRIKRLGQDKDIQYTYLLADVGITRLMENNLMKKDWLDKEIKKHIMDGDAKEWLKKVL